MKAMIRWVRRSLAILLVVLWSWGLGACSSDRPIVSEPPRLAKASAQPAPRLFEVAPPAVIQELRKDLEIYQPQVEILSPRPNQVIEDTTVSVSLQVTDLPTFKDETWGSGPHLHFFLDNQPYRAIYDPSDPVILEDLTPGTHTIRVFASRPWHESFKNEGAYAQATFHVFTQTPDNNPDPNLPLLTYSRPQGTYGAEPILLDFYLSNAPLHLVAQADPADDILDWQIRCTLNGQSFTFDTWEPIYLKGFKPGRNWVQLELLDDRGQPIPNAFNNAVRLVTYEPEGSDTLSKLVRGELTVREARTIVDPNYVPPAPNAIAPEVEPEIESAIESNLSEPEVAPEPQPAVDAPQTPEPVEHPELPVVQPDAMPEEQPSPPPVIPPPTGLAVPPEPGSIPEILPELAGQKREEEKAKEFSEVEEAPAATEPENSEAIAPKPSTMTGSSLDESKGEEKAIGTSLDTQSKTVPLESEAQSGATQPEDRGEAGASL